MRVDLYHVDQSTEEETLEVADVSLESCFPDDPDDAKQVEQELQSTDFTFYGGGAAPLFKIVRRKSDCRHRNDGRGRCIDCGEFLPSAEGKYWE